MCLLERRISEGNPKGGTKKKRSGKKQGAEKKTGEKVRFSSRRGKRRYGQVASAA